MIVMYRNGVRCLEMEESDVPEISKKIEELAPTIIGIVMLSTDGAMLSYVKEIAPEA